MKTIKTLLVDDEPEILDVLEECIGTAFKPPTKVQFCKVSNGAEALNELANQPFDLVVADLKMPVCNGTDMIHRLRNTKGGNSDIPIVVLSGFISTHQTERVENIFYLEKPFRSERLVRMLNMVVAGQESRKSANASG